LDLALSFNSTFYERFWQANGNKTTGDDEKQEKAADD
jgi:hypothetical protein